MCSLSRPLGAAWVWVHDVWLPDYGGCAGPPTPLIAADSAGERYGCPFEPSPPPPGLCMLLLDAVAPFHLSQRTCCEKHT
eukprot:5667066-Karenia_brevis.AAC.1